MLFNSFTFIAFLGVIIFVSRLTKSWHLRKTFLLLASYIFYSAWNPPFVVLLWISTIADWFIAKRLYLTQHKNRKKIYLSLSLLINLGMLAYFKYGLFFLDNFIAALDIIGVTFQPARPSIILPVGISFYTFQTLSYTFDIYKQKAKPWNSFLDYALYVSFFPQLVAGPIVRAKDFLPQCSKPKVGSIKQISWGLVLFTIGLFNKVVIADSFMAPYVIEIFGSNETLSFFEAWAGATAFSVQIFCDFAGYSTCAIGVALTLGFVLPDNFRFPYAAVGFSDFWRRWHISLSSWLKDYLYISLGGNRKGTVGTHINLMLTMLIGGLWHGSSWLFVIWGGLHGLYLNIERVLKTFKWAHHKLWQTAIVRFGLSLMTYFFVCIAWVFFRAHDLPKAIAILESMVGVNSFHLNAGLSLSYKSYLLIGMVTITMIAIHWLLRNKALEDLFKQLNWPVSAFSVTAMAYCIIISMSGEDHAFIYFQF